MGADNFITEYQTFRDCCPFIGEIAVQQNVPYQNCLRLGEHFFVKGKRLDNDKQLHITFLLMYNVQCSILSIELKEITEILEIMLPSLNKIMVKMLF